MFTGFMDESGIASGDRACVIAGFVGTGDECDKVGDEWSVLVKPLGELHSCEFFSRRSDGSLTGIYKHLNVGDAESCVHKLIDMLAESKLEPMGMALDARAFMSLHEDERRWMTSAVLYDKSWPMQGAIKTPWFAPFHYCVTQANGYTPEGEKIHLTFDRQNEFEGNARKIYQELKDLGGKWGGRLAETLTFSSRSEAVLLQAADLLAYVMAWAVLGRDMRDKVAAHALEKLGYNKEYVRAGQ